jgi:hypothetical protein
MGCEVPWKVTGSFLEIVPFEGPLVGSANSARARRCRATFCELVHLCNTVERCPRASTSESALFSKAPTHLDNEQSLVAAAQAGDSDAFVTLLVQYSRDIYRVGLSITGNHRDAEDFLQESSLKAYRAIAEFQGKRASTVGWRGSQ